MTIFSRITDIINANISTLLERAEDPEKMIRLMIQEMEDTLVEVRSQAVRTIADRREIERKIERLETSAREWEDKAAFAAELVGLVPTVDLGRGAPEMEQLDLSIYLPSDTGDTLWE